MNNAENDLNRLVNDPDYNLALTLSHHDFVTGMIKNDLQCSFVPSSKWPRTANNMHVLYSIICVFSPLLTVPFFSYHFGNWWLLFGIIFSYTGTILAVSGYNLPLYAGLFFLAEAIKGHWHFKDYDDLFYVCAAWGWAWGKIAGIGSDSYSLEQLIKQPRLYRFAVEKRKLIVFRRSQDNTEDHL